jgi:hypothetical protein
MSKMDTSCYLHRITSTPLDASFGACARTYEFIAMDADHRFPTGDGPFPDAHQVNRQSRSIKRLIFRFCSSGFERETVEQVPASLTRNMISQKFDTIRSQMTDAFYADAI